MKRALTFAAVTVALLGTLAAYAPAAQASPAGRYIDIQILPSTGPMAVAAGQAITFHVKVTGMVLDAQDMGQAPAPGKGHLQIYVDRIPTAAYSRKVMGHTLLAAAVSPDFTVTLSKAKVRSRGHHLIIVALAKNNDVLYRLNAPALDVMVQ